MGRAMMAMKQVHLTADFAVVGGGMSGIAAAIAAAREGLKVVLMHDRPVLGGNASSEIRMWICGAHGDNLRESGIIEEIMLENFARNPESNYSIWDEILYTAIRREKNITLLLNTACFDADMAGDKIIAIRGLQPISQTVYEVSAAYFADCSGDSVLIPLTGAEFRQGREGRDEFGESIAPAVADDRTMGMSCLLQGRETAAPVEYTAPEWANHYTSDADFKFRSPELEGLQNFWWIELGGEGNALHEVDQNRDELLKIAFGVWDYLKNHPAKRERYRNWELEWVGFLPGKRESRRYVGDLVMTQNDVRNAGKFPDTIAYGGWTMDDHHPGGFRYPGEPTTFHPAPSPYGIAYRCVYSRNIVNLFCAGRNISVTHSALSSTRVMATCALLGQAVGSAAALAKRYQLSPREVGERHLHELQQLLQENDAYLPGFRYQAPALTVEAHLAASSGNPEGLRGGLNRVVGDTDESWNAAAGDFAEYTWETPRLLSETRIIFDSDLSRPQRNLVALRFLNAPKLALPAALVKHFKVEYRDIDGHWHLVRETNDNFRRLHRIPLQVTATGLRLTLLETRQGATRVFAWNVR